MARQLFKGALFSIIFAPHYCSYGLVGGTVVFKQKDSKTHAPIICTASDIHEANTELVVQQTSQLVKGFSLLPADAVSKVITLIEDWFDQNYLTSLVGNDEQLKQAQETSEVLSLDDPFLFGLTATLKATGVNAQSVECRHSMLRKQRQDNFILDDNAIAAFIKDNQLAEKVYEWSCHQVQATNAFTETQKSALLAYLETLKNRTIYYNQAVIEIIKAKDKRFYLNKINTFRKEDVAAFVDLCHTHLQTILGDNWIRTMDRAHINYSYATLLVPAMPRIFCECIVGRAALLDMALIGHICAHWDKECIVIIAGLAHIIEITVALDIILNYKPLFTSVPAQQYIAQGKSPFKEIDLT
jgi:hypothetical protein